jgi:hypothetical protein
MLARLMVHQMRMCLKGMISSTSVSWAHLSHWQSSTVGPQPMEKETAGGEGTVPSTDPRYPGSMAAGPGSQHC